VGGGVEGSSDEEEGTRMCPLRLEEMVEGAYLVKRNLCVRSGEA